MTNRRWMGVPSAIAEGARVEVREKIVFVEDNGGKPFYFEFLMQTARSESYIAPDIYHQTLDADRGER